MSNPLYIRVRGRVLGPYEPEKLQALAQQGQFSRMHEVSEDGASWVKATNYPELFTSRVSTASLRKAPAASQAPSKQAVATEAAPPSEKPAPDTGGQDNATWYYTSYGQEVGPVSLADLQQAARSGQIGSDDQAWSEGMPQWVPASQVVPLAPAVVPSGGAVADTAPMPAAGSQQACEVPDDVVRSLAGSRPWILLVGIVLMIECVLGLIGSIYLLSAGSRFDALAFTAISGVTGLITSIVMGVAGWLLILFASRIGAMSYRRTFASLCQALDASRAFWIFVGILSIIYVTYMSVLLLWIFAVAGRLT